jgi:hypothetical protein
MSATFGTVNVKLFWRRLQDTRTLFTSQIRRARRPCWLQGWRLPMRQWCGCGGSQWPIGTCSPSTHYALTVHSLHLLYTLY